MKILFFFVVAVVCCASSCVDNPFVERVYSIKVQNNTNDIVVYLESYSYPDTIIPDRYNDLSGISKMGYQFFDSKVKWDQVFAEKRASKISFFFFNNDTIVKYGWQQVRNGYRVLKRKDFTLQELKNAQYLVTYP